MQIEIATLFPEMCEAVLSESIIGRARAAGHISVRCWNIREYTLDKHRRVDDVPYGGGRGMVMQADPIYRCYDAVQQDIGAKPHVIYMSPKSRVLDQQRALELSVMPHIFVLCGHAEGVDQRILDEIVDEVRGLVAQGVKEFQMIAQDLTFYGLDRYKRMALPELVERVSDIPGVEWIRLHYGYPSHFPYDLLPVMRERDNVCKYMDIALQHISDPMLKMMRRNITKAETYELLERMRREVPGIHLRTTLMVGHPGETEQDFEELIRFVKDIRFERMGAFAYSHEEGTYAYQHYKDEIPQEVKQDRLDYLMRVQEGISADVNASKVGQTFRVIVDREEEDFYVGRTQYDSPEVDPEILISKDTPLSPGSFYQVKVIDAQAFDLYGKVLN